MKPEVSNIPSLHLITHNQMVKERFVQAFKTAMMKSKLSGEKMKPSPKHFLARYILYGTKV